VIVRLPIMLFAGICFSLVCFIALFELVRRKKMKERMALYWTSLPLLALIFAIDPFVTSSVSRFLGFTLVSNFLLVSLTLLLLLLTLYLSAIIGKMEDRINIMAEEIAIINGKIEK
jgi:hypothetical protein